MERLPHESDGDFAEKVQLLLLALNPVAGAGMSSPAQHTSKYKQYMDEEAGAGAYGFGRRMGMVPGLGAAAVADIAESIGVPGLLTGLADIGRGVVGGARPTTAPPGKGGAFPPNAGPQAEAPFDIEAFIRSQSGKPARGGVGGRVSLAELTKETGEDRDRTKALLDTIRAVKTGLGALEAQRPLTETFDTAAADKRLRGANPERRPDNADYWMWQAADRYDREKGWVPSSSKDAAARLMFDVDKRAETSYETAIAKLLGMEKEGAANRTLTKKEEFDRMVATLLAQMPNKMEADLTKDLSKTGLAQAKVNAAIQMRGQNLQRDSANEERLKMAADLLRAGKIKPDDFLNLKKQMAFGAPAKAPEYSGDKLYADTLASLTQSKIGGKIAVSPEIAHQVAMGVARGEIDPTNPLAYAEKLYRKSLK